MEKLGIIIAFYAFFGCLWWMVAKISGHGLIKLVLKTFGITGCIISFIYILKYFNII